ncbi:hypothetical protein ACRFBT_26530 [Pseudomonas aeruginosa]|uniref:hypothetical protein n=1 Tax=Pseudomonas aeruginosa TaxID=287 RepID=UPI003D6F878A
MKRHGDPAMAFSTRSGAAAFARFTGKLGDHLAAGEVGQILPVASGSVMVSSWLMRGRILMVAAHRTAAGRAGAGRAVRQMKACAG